MKIHLQSKATPVYDNCHVEAPDGSLLFTSKRKRLEWYLKRSLAVKTSDDPFTIRLLFQPKGSGDIDELKAHKRNNECCVCGSSDALTMHHILPSEYRQHAPIPIKARASILVVPLCPTCHATYEKHARELRKELHKADKPQKPTKAKGSDCPLIGLINTLEKKTIEGTSHKLPQPFFDKMAAAAKNVNTDIVPMLDPTTRHNLPPEAFKAKLKELAPYDKEDRLNKSTYDILNSPAKSLMDEINAKQDWLAFSMLWLNHFIETMHPQRMPPYLNEAILKKWIETRTEKMVLPDNPRITSHENSQDSLPGTLRS